MFDLCEQKQAEVSGDITLEGKRAIFTLLAENGIELPSDFNWMKINRAGKLSKRIGKYAYTQGVKLPDSIISTIGNLASIHSYSGEKLTYDFTDVFDWQAGDFGDSGSCYWGCHAAARDMLANNEAMAIRFYNPDGSGYARAWIATDNDNLIAWNAYGIDLVTVAKLLAQLQGYTYKKIRLDNNGQADGTLWINNGSGYAVGADLSNVDSVDLGWDDDSYTCDMCGSTISEDDSYSVDYGILCHECYYEHYTNCERCGESVANDDAHQANDCDYCEHCYSRLFHECEHCGEGVRKGDAIRYDGDWFCESCHDDLHTTCEHCEDVILADDAHYLNGYSYCNNCHEKILAEREGQLVMEFEFAIA